MYTHSSNYINQAIPLSEAKSAIIMIHGRGSTAGNIASLSRELKLSQAAVLAPQANHNSWYPYSFLAPVEENQPALDSALAGLDELVNQVKTAGIALDQIYFLGFSQGACLALEYSARNAAVYGGVIAFTGGLIGQQLNYDNYKGDFGGMPVLITTGNPDPHVPVSRVEESAELFKKLGAKVTLRIYDGRPHTIQHEEIDLANDLFFS